MQSKPGIRTTEFWVTAASLALVPIVMVVNGVYGVELDIDVYTRVAATLGSFINATLAASWYTRGRTAVKAQDVKAGAVLNAYQGAAKPKGNDTYSPPGKI